MARPEGEPRAADSGRTVEPDLTVVIPTLGRPILERSLVALERGDVLPARVILVNQGDYAETERLACRFRERGLQVTHLPSGESGRAAGVNRGLEQVATRWAAVTDDDCLAAPDWVARMATALRRDEGAIITGRVEAGDGEVVLSVVTSDRPAIQRRPRLKFDLLSGGNMGIALATFQRVGSFDQNRCVQTAEDAEFAYRALRAGVPIVYAPDVVVCHLGWRGAEARDAQYRLYARSHGGFYGKYLRRGDVWIALRTAVHFFRALRRWTTGTLRGDREQARHARAYLTGLGPGIAAGWRSYGRR